MKEKGNHPHRRAQAEKFQPDKQEGLPIPGVQLKGNRRVIAKQQQCDSRRNGQPHRQSPFFRPPVNPIILRSVQPVADRGGHGAGIVRRRNKGAIRRLRRAVDRRRRRALIRGISRRPARTGRDIRPVHWRLPAGIVLHRGSHLSRLTRFLGHVGIHNAPQLVHIGDAAFRHPDK